MKTFGIIFLIFAGVLVYNNAKANTLPVHQYAYCSGYAAQMGKTYRLKYYYNMQKFYDAKIENQSDQLTTEYYQSGTEAVKTNTAIKQNLKDKCEVQFKGNA